MIFLRILNSLCYNKYLSSEQKERNIGREREGRERERRERDKEQVENENNENGKFLYI
jgi:hypothetical protein